MVSLQFTPSSRHPVETPLNTPKTPLHTACLNYTPFPAYAIIVPFHMRTKHTSSRWGSWVNPELSRPVLRWCCPRLGMGPTKDGLHRHRPPSIDRWRTRQEGHSYPHPLLDSSNPFLNHPLSPTPATLSWSLVIGGFSPRRGLRMQSKVQLHCNNLQAAYKHEYRWQWDRHHVSSIWFLSFWFLIESAWFEFKCANLLFWTAPERKVYA